MKYYSVLTKCGHVGKNKCILIEFGVVAENGREAAHKARFLPRVKHDQKDAILKVKEVSEEEYLEIRRINSLDKYLSCDNSSDQKFIEGLQDRIIDDDQASFHKAKMPWRKLNTPDYSPSKRNFKEKKFLDYIKHSTISPRKDKILKQHLDDDYNESMQNFDDFSETENLKVDEDFIVTDEIKKYFILDNSEEPVL